MSEPRSYEEVRAEQVAQAAAAVRQAVADANAQQGAGQRWMESGFPADTAAHPIGGGNAPNV